MGWPSNGAKNCQARLGAGQGQTRLGTAGDVAGQGTSRTINSHERMRGFGTDVIISPPPSCTHALLGSCVRPETRLQKEGGLPVWEAAGRRGCLLLKAFGAFHQGQGKTAFNCEAGGKWPSPGIRSCCPAALCSQHGPATEI